MLIAIAVLNNLEIRQMDVKTACLNDELAMRFICNNPMGSLLLVNKRKCVDLLSCYMGLNKHLSSDMKNLIKLFYRMVSRLMNVTNVST